MSHNDAQRVGAPLLKDRLRQMELFSLEMRRFWGDLTVAFMCLKAAYEKEGKRLFIWPQRQNKGQRF